MLGPYFGTVLGLYGRGQAKGRFPPESVLDNVDNGANYQYAVGSACRRQN